MSTTNPSPHALDGTPAPSPSVALRDAARWVRDTPAPRWEGDAGQRATYVAYVAASVVGWTGLGLLASAAMGEAVAAFVAWLG